MADNSIKRGLEKVEVHTKDWPDWKRKAAAEDFGMPEPTSSPFPPEVVGRVAPTTPEYLRGFQAALALVREASRTRCVSAVDILVLQEPAVDPLAAAEERLGKWLVTGNGQGFSFGIRDRGETWISDERWQCRLRGSARIITQCAGTKAEAIMAALDAAKAP